MPLNLSHNKLILVVAVLPLVLACALESPSSDAYSPVPTPTATIDPTLLPPLARWILHPEHETGCESLGRFQLGMEDHWRPRWSQCERQLEARIRDTCRKLPTTDEQRRCGKEAVKEYNSIRFRHGQLQCSGIVDFDDWNSCGLSQTSRKARVTDYMWEALQRVRVGGDRDPAVAQTKERFAACLEDRGYRGVEWHIMLWWQYPHDTWGRSDEVALVNEIYGPAKKCGHQTGLFKAQAKAWATELTRLYQEEPTVFEDLVREGALEALEREDPPPLVTGELP